LWLEIDREKSTAGLKARAREWAQRSKVLEDVLVAAMRKNVRTDMTPADPGP
jgi:hypothetical protein